MAEVEGQPNSEVKLPTGKEIAKEKHFSITDYDNGVFLVSSEPTTDKLRTGVLPFNLASSLSLIRSLGYNVEQVLPVGGESAVGLNKDIVILCQKTAQQ